MRAAAACHLGSRTARWSRRQSCSLRVCDLGRTCGMILIQSHSTADVSMAREPRLRRRRRRHVQLTGMLPRRALCHYASEVRGARAHQQSLWRQVGCARGPRLTTCPRGSSAIALATTTTTRRTGDCCSSLSRQNQTRLQSASNGLRRDSQNVRRCMQQQAPVVGITLWKLQRPPTFPTTQTGRRRLADRHHAHHR